MDGQHQLVAVADEDQRSLGEAPQVLHAGVVLRHLEGEAGGVIGVLQVGAVDILVGLGHLVSVGDEAGEQGQIRGLRANLLGEEAILLAAVGILLDDLPPALDGLAIGERLGVVVPEGLGGIQGEAELQILLINVGADVPGIEGFQNALVIILEEHVAVNVLGLEYVGSDIVGAVLDLSLAQNFAGVQVGDHQIQAGIHLLKTLFTLKHLGGGGIDVDLLGAALNFLKGLLIEFLVGHVAPLVPIGAIDLFTSLGIVAELAAVGLGGAIAAVGLGGGGIAAVGGRSVRLAAAGRQAQHHNGCQ